MTGALEAAFADDHRAMTRTFQQILEALDAHDLQRATDLADQLDRLAAGHIAFEEEILYPEVRRRRGQAYARTLYDEHAIAVAALSELRRAEPIGHDARERVRAGINTGLEHAVSCATLTSILADQPEEVQEEMLRRLIELRGIGARWSELRGSR